MFEGSSKILTHAQNFEDVLLWRLFSNVQGGIYVDVGAYDPVLDSISKNFYDAGWRGINVDASFVSAQRFRDERPDEVFLHAAITDEPGPVTFYEFPGTGLSTCVAEIAARHESKGLSSNMVTAPTMPLSTVLDTAAKPDIHWLKVDVEGAEAAVLRSWYPSKVRPWVLVIESTAPNSQVPTHHEWAHIVKSLGYDEVLFDGLSRFYVSEAHSELIETLRASPNIFDGFHIPATHFSAEKLVAQWAEERRLLEVQIERSEAQSTDALSHSNQLLQKNQSLSDELDQTKSSLDHYSKHALALQLESEKNIRKISDLEIEILKCDYERAALNQELESTRELLRIERQKIVELKAFFEGSQKTKALEFLSERTEVIKRYDSQLVDLNSKFEALQIALGEALRLSADLQSERVSNEQRWNSRIDELGSELRFERSALAEANALLAMVAGSNLSLSYWIGNPFARQRRNNHRKILDRIERWISNQVDGAKPEISHLPFAARGQAEQPQDDAMDIFTHDNRNPYMRADSLEELCSHADSDFVRRAYVTILGRQPDPDGEAYYCSRVRAGVSKLTIISQLRMSPEGREHDPGISGLDAVLRRHRRANIPIFGWFLRALTGAEGSTAIERKLRAIENSQIVAANQANGRFLHVNHLLIELSSGLDQIGRELRQVRAGTAGDPSQLQRSLSQSHGDWKTQLQASLES